MSLAMDRPKAMFGQITLDDMSGNEALTRAVLPLVRDVCEHSKRITLETVTDGLVSGLYELWGVTSAPPRLDAIVLTQVDGDALTVVLAGPDLAAVSPHFRLLESVARSKKLKRLRLFGPWRWHDDLGDDWRLAATLYERALG